MHPGREYDRFANRYVLRSTRKVGDNEHVDVVARQTLAKDRLPDLVFVLVRARLRDIPAQVRVGVGVAMCEVDRVAIGLGRVLEGQAVIVLAVAVVVGLQGVDILIHNLIGTELLVAAERRRVLILEGSLRPIRLVVRNVLAFSLPAKLGALRRVPQGVDQRSHAFSVRRFRLHEVDQVEPVRLVLASVLDSEVVPLGEALRAVVILKIQIIFEWPDFHSFPEVAALESGLKDQRFVRRQIDLWPIVVARRAHLRTRCATRRTAIIRIAFTAHRLRALLVVGVLLDFGVHSVVRFQSLVIAVQAWTIDSLPLLGNLRLRLIGVDLTEVVVLLQAVWQVLRIEVVTFLVRLVDRSVALVLRMWQLDDVALVDVWTMF